MLTQQDIYAAGCENRPPMLNKDNYNGPYIRRIIREPRDPNSVPHVAESTHEHTDDELTDQEAKQIEADDQAIQTILMSLP
ncbi:hypothetical protein Tco_0580973 [Tanacetum coccineum]